MNNPSADLSTKNLPHELVSTIHNVYTPAQITITSDPICEAESSEYSACRFGLNNHNLVFRIAKTTPTKIGQFVTLWKRPIKNGEIVPFDSSDNVDFVVVHASNSTDSGQFIFNHEILIKQGIMSHHGKKGKLAVRVYPPWSHPIAKQAIKTQQWQLKYFLPFSKDGTANLTQVHRLFNL